MAGRPKKVVEKAVEEVVVEDKTAEEYKKELENLKAMMEELLAKAKPVPVTETEVTSPDEKEIKPDDYVEIISLCPHLLNLTTEEKGKGKKFSFNEFGEKKRILYSDLLDVMENHTEYTDFLREGYYYINDARVVSKHGLDDVYATNFTKENIEKLLAGQLENAIELFKLASESQKQLIVEMLISKMAGGETMDLNLISQIEDIADRKITETVKSIKFYRELDEKEKKR